MKLNTVALIGAGAIGSYFIECLTEKLKDNFWVVAEGERKSRLESAGLIINDKNYNLNVKNAAETAGVDLLIIGVKYGALPGVLPMVKQIVKENTLVIIPMNGVDSEEIIGKIVPAKQIMHSFMKIASQRVGNSIHFHSQSTPGLYFGELDGKESDRTKALVELFEGTDFHYVLSEDIQRDMWIKFALNISNNLPQAIVNCGLGGYKASEHLSFINKVMREEVVAVAAAKGIDINPRGEAKEHTAAMSPAARFSTLQDLDAKRHTEIDMFSGALVKMGKELGVSTPFNEFAFHVIKCLEEKNDGIIQ